jgi:hypothetical protein
MQQGGGIASRTFPPGRISRSAAIKSAVFCSSFFSIKHQKQKGLTIGQAHHYAKSSFEQIRAEVTAVV